MENTLKFHKSHEQVIVKKDIIGDNGGIKVDILVENPGNEIRDFMLRAEIEIENISNSYVLFPGAVYDGNKADEINPDPYPPRLKNFERTGQDGPVIIADIPRYEEKLVLQTYDLTMPSCGIYYDDTKKGIIVKTDIGPVETPYGFELKDESIAICFPCVREKRYRHCAKYDQPSDKGIILGNGASRSFGFEIIYSSASCRADFAGEMSKLFHPVSNGVYDYEILARSCINKINREDFNDEEGFYMDSGESRRFQSGWVSGMITTYTMLLSDFEIYHERAKRTIRFLLDKGISPCGLPMGIYDEKGWRGLSLGEGMDFAGTHIRRILDAVFYLYKILKLEKLDSMLHAGIENAVFSATERLSLMIDTYGHFGHSIDLNSGDVMWGGSAAGVTGITCLCAGYFRYGRSDWLEAAEKAGGYYRRFNENGCWNGGPGDILMAPDSESTYAAMEAFYHLYTVTGKELWKSEFLKASNLMSTWICMVDFDFPKGSTYEKLGVGTKGLVGANSQNKTLAPGICTASGYLFKKASEFADNDFFINIPKMLLDGASGIAKVFNGSIPEDVNASDSLADRGELYPGHGIWTENAYLLMTMESYYE